MDGGEDRSWGRSRRAASASSPVERTPIAASFTRPCATGWDTALIHDERRCGTRSSRVCLAAARAAMSRANAGVSCAAARNGPAVAPAAIVILLETQSLHQGGSLAEGVDSCPTGDLVVESVELATILLTDLVGSTRLATSIGPVRADELRDEHFGLLRDAIVSCESKEFKNTGDGLMVAFASASAAVTCAVSMQQLFERRYRRAEQGLHVRIGLGAGESTVKDGDYFGMPSIEAARLCAQAPTDGILISAAVKMLAGRCEGVEFEAVGELELKGFAGRVDERAAIEEAMVLARDRARQLVLLSGEPGIGKTRLASYAAHRAHAEGFAVCWGGCSE